MIDIQITDVTTGAINGTGVFDKLMSTVKAHIAEEYDKGRIKGQDYATVYLGMIQSVLQQSIEYVLREKMTEAQIAGVEKETELKSTSLKLQESNENNIKIIGDLPIYVSYDSADVWAHPEEFQLDENLCPIEVAGCPPDGFSADGQLWGNPLFNWDYMKETGYQWWVNRIAYQSKIYDVIRIDHFRGFDEYYAIPYGDSTAKNGYWKPGPGMDLFTTIENKLGKLPIIAEDLGFLTDSVKQLLASTGFPGMKVLEFAFDSRDTGSGYLPHCYPNNCVVYTGTHDNDTILGWMNTATDPEVNRRE